MKRLTLVVFVTLVLVGTTFAGEIPSGGIAPPPPPPPGNAITATPGEVPTSGSYEIADAALDLIQMFIGVGI